MNRKGTNDIRRVVTPSISASYNRLGQKTQVIDASGTNTFDYSDNLQLVAEENVGQASSLSRLYDALGRSVGYSLSGGTAASQSVIYDYDTLGRFSSVSSAVPGVASGDVVVDYSYLEGSSLISGYTATPGGSAASLTVAYDFEANRNNKTQVLNQFGTNVISQFDYQYDELNRRTQRLDSSPASLPSVQTNLFDYNDRSELTSAAMSTNDYSYAYDSIGNRTNCSVGSVSQSYVANKLNQYASISNSTLSAPRAMLYDADGNLTNDSVNAYAWNGENRLVKVEPLSPTNNSNRLEFKYDYMGRRVSKEVYIWDNAQSLWSKAQSLFFTYDGWNLISEVELNPQSEIVNQKSYVWGLDLSQSTQGAGGVGGLLSVTVAGGADPGPFFPAYDANGNIIDYVSTNGNLAAHFAYDAFGNTTSESVAQGLEPKVFSVRFSTKYFDTETGLSYYGFRYYVPEAGRWLNRDPIGERGGVNLYSLCANNPLNFFDILGLCCTKEERATALSEYVSCMDTAGSKATTATATAKDEYDSMAQSLTEMYNAGRAAVQAASTAVEKATDAWLAGRTGDPIADLTLQQAVDFANDKLTGVVLDMEQILTITGSSQVLNKYRLDLMKIEGIYNIDKAACLSVWEGKCNE